MPKLTWDATGEKLFEVGVDHCVLYLLNDQAEYTPGVAWNGITQVAESPEGAEPESQYADNIKYLTLVSAEELNGTIEAFMAPPEWDQCDGNSEVIKGVTIGQQSRRSFGLSYRTKVGNDIVGQDYGYKLHLLYGAQASPSERTYETMNDSPEPITFSWEFSTTPVAVTDHKPTALLTINSTLVDKDKLAAFEDILYGTADTDPRMPLPDEVFQLFEGNSEAAAAARMASRAINAESMASAPFGMTIS